MPPVVSTLSGTGDCGFKDGPGNQSQFKCPASIVQGPDGTMYVADQAVSILVSGSLPLQRYRTSTIEGSKALAGTTQNKKFISSYSGLGSRQGNARKQDKKANSRTW